MKNTISLILILVCTFGYSQESTAEYVGNKKCKMCHNSEAKGAQFSKWEATGHARAFEALLTDEAKAIAVKKGLKTTPDKAGECLQCHVTGWGSPTGYQLEVNAEDKKAVSENEALQSVGCESCHGAGSLYKSKQVMLAVREGQTPPASVGLVMPDEQVCLACHNAKSPTFKPFDFKERVAKIAHSYPQP